MGIEIRDNNNIPDLLRILRDLQERKLEIGVFANEGADVVVIAATHEFGAPSINVPERSFMRSTFDEKEAEYVQLMEKMIEQQVLTGRMSVDQFYRILGEKIVGDIKEKITTLQTPPLQESTIKQKGSSNPLIDTGQNLRAKITYKVS